MRVVLEERRTPWRLAGGSVAGRLSTPSSKPGGLEPGGRARLPRDALDHRGSSGGAPALRARGRALGGAAAFPRRSH